MYCGYCEIFAQGNKRKKEMLGNKSVYYRHCPVKRAFVNKNEDACDEFKRNHIFWCSNESMWLTFQSCLNRQKRKEECTSRCRQKKDVNDIMRREYFLQKRRNKKTKELQRRK